jgi:hypothetical protein
MIKPLGPGGKQIEHAKLCEVSLLLELKLVKSRNASGIVAASAGFQNPDFLSP